MVLFGAWKGPRGYLGPIWPLMRCLGPPETPLKSLQGTTLAPSGPPGTIPKGGGSAREVPRTPSSNSIKFICLPRFASWTANSLPHGLHERSRGPPTADKAIKNNLFSHFQNRSKRSLGALGNTPEPPREPSGTKKKSGGRPKGLQGSPRKLFQVPSQHQISLVEA